MMKNYLANLKVLSLVAVILVSLGWNVATAQNCTITGPAEVCAGFPAVFSVVTDPALDAVTWSTSSGQSAIGGTAQFTHGSMTTVTITVTITRTGGGTCTDNVVLEVHDNPTSNFVLLSDPSQCYKANLFCFQDLSTPGVNRTLVSQEFLPGDNSPACTSGLGGTCCHSYPDVSGGKMTPYQRVVNDKGCAADFQIPNLVNVIPDIGVDFSTGATISCGTTTAPITNLSSVPYNRVKKYFWDFGDGQTYTSGVNSPGIDSCYWSPTHVYDQHGCFTVTLIVQDDSNCWDTMIKSDFVCNVNPSLVIQESNGKDAQCQIGNDFTFTHNVTNPKNWPVNFLWVFDDPDSGPQNFNNKNFNGAQHSFTAPNIYTVTISGTMANCPFFASFDVLTKGPAAAIDNKGKGDIIADSQRHQCQIKDTVYFKNNSSFAFNDTNVLNDIPKPAASELKENNMVLIELTDSSRKKEDIIDIFVWYGVAMGVVEKPLKDPATVILHELDMFNNYFGAWGGRRQDDHTRTVWDFGDQTAPQCTTWTKYMQNVWDANGEWMNCNYSRDPKPKHWYTPGEEGCYTVMLTITDTTFQKLPDDGFNYANGGVFNDTVRFVPYMTLDSLFDFPPSMAGGDTVWVYNPNCAAEKIDYVRVTDPTKKFWTGEYDTTFGRWYINPNVQNGNFCEAMTTVLLALEPPNAAGMIVKPAKGVFCLGSNPTWGVNFDWSKTTPSCTRQHVWMNFDSLLDRLDATPAILDKWTPQSGFLLNPTTPWPLGTLSMPQYPNEIYYDYTGKIADSCGHITVGLRVQNGYDPHTKQPCIDEKWYHHMLNYVNSDPEFTLDTVYGCEPLEVELTFDREYHDSLEALMINVSVNNTLDGDFNKGFLYIDSVYRDKYDPRTGQNINYILTFYVDRSGIPKKIDSTVWTPAEGGLQGCGSELRIKTKRTLTFREGARYNVVTSAKTTDGCLNVSKVKHVVVGFGKNIEQNKTLICKNEEVEFEDIALYWLLDPDPVTGAEWFPYEYWRDNNRILHPDGTPRSKNPLYEDTRWDFGQGIGFTSIRFNPITVSYDVPGHYKVKAEFMDSIGCRDTMFLEVDVTGGKAHFGFVESVNLCKPIVNFFDSSKVYDPCRIKYGTACDSVIRWIWDFGDGTPITDTDVDNPNSPAIRNPSHVYEHFGDYDVKLIIKTRMGCWDTIISTVSIAGPMPRFDFIVDSIGCAPYTVYLGNFSLDPTPDAQWTWNFNDTGNTSITTRSDSVIYFTYYKPGKYQITMDMGDTVPLTKEWCTASYPPLPKIMEVEVLPEKKVDFTASKLFVCPNEEIIFTDSSDAAYTTFVWDMGDSTVYTLDSAQGGKQIKHSYAEEGTYVVRLNPDYTPPVGIPKCRQSKALVITVRKVKASFTTDTAGMPQFWFDNTSENGVEFQWKFEDDGDFIPCPQADPDNCPNAQFNYGNKLGCNRVILVAKSPEGCYDTAWNDVCNFFETSIFIPNVFTPDGDNFNDVFKVEIKGWEKYEIKIYNRFSEKVFESTDPDNPWNGKKNNSGADLPAGVYYVVINYQLRGQAEQTYNGTVTLIR